MSATDATRRDRFARLIEQGSDVAREATFWSRCRVAENGCWVWTASLSAGYGQFLYKGVSRRATHEALERDGRPKPFYDAVARHSCDNPVCVNPAHLDWGTARENVQDAIGRGRFSFAALRRRHSRQRAARLVVQCAHCGKAHTKPKNKVAKAKRVFCSRACHYASRSSGRGK